MKENVKQGLRVKLRYLAKDQDLAVYMTSVAGGEVMPHQGSYEEKTVVMENGRDRVEQFGLERQGFQLLKHVSKTSDYFDDNQIADIYNNEIQNLVLETTGASRVEVFDNTRRASSQNTRKKKQVREQATTIHNDYTDYSAPKRLREILPDEADSLLQRRYAIVNVWRSIAGTVENYPLAMCDAESTDTVDLVAVKRQARDRVGEIQFVTFDSKHRWVYFPKMGMNEVLMFKTFDSAQDGRARFTVHSSFDDPSAVKNPAVRESIETRCFVFF